MSTFRASSLLAITALLASSPGHADGIRAGLATVSQVDGVVLVSEGGRFSTASVGGGVLAGGRLLTMENAAAAVTYGDGCRLEVPANTMVVFRSPSECTNNTVDSEAAGRQYASLGAPTAGAAVASSGAVATTTAAVSSAGAIGSPSRGSAEPGLFGVPAEGVVAGAAAFGTLAYFLAHTGNNSNNDPQVTPETF